MMTLSHSPGSCSDGIVLLLSEVGADFQIEVIEVHKGMQHDPAFKAKNPKGKVPTLLLADGTVMTEFQSIAYWIANAYPDKGLWPETLAEQQATLSVLDFIVASLHMRGFTFVKVPKKFQLDAQGTKDLQAFGRGEVDKCLGQLSEMLGDTDYLMGDSFTIADAAAFYTLKWASEEGFDTPQNLQGLLARIRERPAAKAAFA